MLQAVLDFIGFGLCHQIPERSFFAGGMQVPVCARDTGIYVGFAVAFGVLALLQRDRPSRVPPVWVSAVLALGVLAMLYDGATSYLGLRPTTNELRLLTGLLTGYAIAAWIMPILSGELWRIPGHGRVLGDIRTFALWLVSLGITFAAVWWVGPLLGLVYPVLVAVAIVTTFTVVNAVIVSLLPAFGRRSERLRDASPLLGIALVLTVIELAASAALKQWLLALAT